VSLAPIPFIGIVEFARVYNIEDLEEFLYYIRRLDNLFLEREENKRGSKNGTNESNQNPNEG